MTKKFFYMVMLLVLLFPVVVSSQNYLQLDSLTQALPDIIDNKQRQIDIITKGVGFGGSYEIAKSLFDEYKSFKYDSSAKYALKMIEYADKSNNKFQKAEAQLCYAQILSVAGHFAKAGEMLSMIDTVGLDKQLIVNFLKTKCDLCLYNSEFSENTVLFASYHDSTMYYHRLITKIAEKNSYDYVFSSAVIASEIESYAKGIEILENYFKNMENQDRNYSVVASTLAFFCKMDNNLEEAERYFRISAICDLKNAIMENNSLRALAEMCMERGDIDHAFQYISISGGCATAYGSRLRLSQNSQVAPKIVAEYKAQRDAVSRLTTFFLVLLVVVAVVLVVLIMLIFKERNKLKNANSEIVAKNDELLNLVEKINTVNSNLLESNNIREEYISRFLELCNHILEVTQDRLSTLNKLAREKKMEELYRNLKSEAPINALTELFYKNFDTAFLNIYPDFENEINSKLKPEYAVSIKNGQLTTELRIEALVRIGIGDNKKIASILRSSIATIYTYRSKFRAKMKN